MNINWIKDVNFKHINGPTLYMSIASVLAMVAVQGLGWHLNATTVVGFFGIVGAFIWNNGKFGLKAVHSVNFVITVLAGVGLVLNNGLGWHIPTTYIQGAIALIIGVIFHVSHANQVVQQATKKILSTPATPAPNSSKEG